MGVVVTLIRSTDLTKYSLLLAQLNDRGFKVEVSKETCRGNKTAWHEENFHHTIGLFKNKD